MIYFDLPPRNPVLAGAQHLWDKQRVWLIALLILLIVFAFDYAQGVSSSVFTLKALQGTAPFLLLSIGVAAYAGATGADSLIAKAFTGSPVSMIVFAAVLGGLSPFCSCGVIPLIAALLAMGVPLSGVMAFWLASPVIDPSMFVLTSGLLGFEFAMAKTVAAIGLGLFGGFTTYALMGAGYFANPLRPDVGNGGCAASTVRNPSHVVWKFWQEQPRRAKFVAEAQSITLFLLKWLTLAFLLESLMLAYVPADWIATALGGTGIMPIITATFVGVPAYLNGYAALPLVSGLIEQGMAQGAGLSFLVAGGVTSLPAAIAVFALVKRPVFALYIVLALSGSMVSGMLFQLWLI
ncbi:MAG: permease [Yoonia sp.]|nr:permease [Yoonia sp.]